MAKISVIVPVYNVEEYLERCIISVLSQSFTDFNLVLVNDGSKDQSGQICDNYKDKDSRIKVIHQENQGLSMARNRGMEEVTEEYITFLDSDDWIHKDTLQILYDNLIHNQGDISICSYRPVYEGEEFESDQITNKVEVLTNIEAVMRIVEDSDIMMITAWGKLYKADLFKEIRYPKGKYHEDEFVTYKVLYNAKTIVVSDAKLQYYTQRTQSITGERYSLKRLEKLEGLKEAVDFFRDQDEKALEIKAKIRYLLNIQIGYYRVRDEMDGQEAVLERLKKTYDLEYQELVKGERFSVKRISLGFFYLFPGVYCRLVKIYMGLVKKGV